MLCVGLHPCCAIGVGFKIESRILKLFEAILKLYFYATDFFKKP